MLVCKASFHTLAGNHPRVRAAFLWSQESKLLNQTSFMLRSEWFESKVKFVGRRQAIASVCLLLATIAFASLSSPFAVAQGTSEFTLTANSFDPAAVGPGGTSSSLIQVGSVNGFSGTVNLSCQVTTSQQTTDMPACAVSPASVTVPASATATVTTLSTTPTVGYQITITGSTATTTYTTPALPLTVLAVVPQFTISVTTTISPTSVPAGSGATGVVTVNPIYGYVSPTGGGVTLACASMTPLVTIAPVCTFTYPPQRTNLQVSGTPASAQLTISTFGPVTTGAASHPRVFYALWISLPLFGVIAIGGVRGKRARRACTVWTLLLLSAALILVPGCGTTTTTTTTPNGVTPANTYSFTIIGVDSNGVVSSNTTSTTAGPTVSLTVTAPPKQP